MCDVMSRRSAQRGRGKYARKGGIFVKGGAFLAYLWINQSHRLTPVPHGANSDIVLGGRTWQPHLDRQIVMQLSPGQSVAG